MGSPSGTKQVGDVTTILHALTGDDVTTYERSGKNLKNLVGTGYSHEQGGESIHYNTDR